MANNLSPLFSRFDTNTRLKTKDDKKQDGVYRHVFNVDETRFYVHLDQDSAARIQMELPNTDWYKFRPNSLPNKDGKGSIRKREATPLNDVQKPISVGKIRKDPRHPTKNQKMTPQETQNTDKSPHPLSDSLGNEIDHNRMFNELKNAFASNKDILKLFKKHNAKMERTVTPSIFGTTPLFKSAETTPYGPPLVESTYNIQEDNFDANMPNDEAENEREEKASSGTFAKQDDGILDARDIYFYGLENHQRKTTPPDTAPGSDDSKGTTPIAQPWVYESAAAKADERGTGWKLTFHCYSLLVSR